MGLRSTKRLFAETEEGECLRRVGKHRKLNCPNYEICLDVAVLLGWKGFSCSRCQGEGPDEVLLGTVLHQLEKWLEGTIDPFAHSYPPILFREYFVPL